ncbi:MAG: ATP-binding protein [Nitrospirae bacterium]|nr:ATP-binding protein [Nitrospirota bacterium]
MKNNLINKIEEGIKAGKASFLLEFNTNDRQMCLEEGIYPTSLHLALASYFGKKGYHCGLFSQGSGLQPVTPPDSAAVGTNPFRQGTNQPLSMLTPVLRRNDCKSVLIVQYSDLLAPAADGSAFLAPEQQVVLECLHRWGSDDAIRQAKNIVILISYEGGVNALLTRSGAYHRVQVSLPDQDTRLEFINLLRNIKEGKFALLEEGLTSEEMSRKANGLRLMDIEALFRAKAGSVISRKDIQTVKSAAIRELAGGLVEVVEPAEGFESIAGLYSVKEYFQFVKWMFQNGSPTVPYAMILAGVPGAGKSKLCGTLAKELDIPLLILRNLHGPFIGQSEGNLERVLNVVESMSPCCILIEEIDQSIGQRGTGPSGDSGVSNRMSQRFWEAIGNSHANRGKNLWIGTSNRPDLLDTAMLDRFQVVIPFLHPTKSQVEELIPYIAVQSGRELAEDIDLASVAGLPNLNLPTVRGLVEVVTSAAQRADFESGKINSQINHRHILGAAMDYKITYDPVQHEHIALKAVEMVSFSSLLPWMGFNGKRSDAEIPEYLVNIVDPNTGYVDSARLNERIRALEQVLYSQKMMR